MEGAIMEEGIDKDLLICVIQFLDDYHYKDIQRVNTEAGALRFKVDRRLNHGATNYSTISETLKRHQQVEKQVMEERKKQRVE